MGYKPLVKLSCASFTEFTAFGIGVLEELTIHHQVNTASGGLRKLWV